MHEKEIISRNNCVIHIFFFQMFVKDILDVKVSPLIIHLRQSLCQIKDIQTKSTDKGIYILIK